jgi:uncharacterized protein involved in outer membrane biogenesis
MLAVLVAVPLLAAGALALLVDAEKIRPVLEAQLSESLRRPVTLRNLSFSLFPPSFHAGELVISDDPAFSQAPFLRAQSLQIRPQLLSLFSAKPKVDSLLMLQPRLEFIENAAGKWNHESLGGQKASADAPPFQLGRLAIEGAVIGVKASEGPREEYSQLSLEIRDYADGKPFPMRLSARMPAGGVIDVRGTVLSTGQRLRLTETSFKLAEVKGTLDGEVNDKALNLKIQIPQAALADLAPVFLPKGMKAGGQVSAAVSVTGTTAKPVLKGKAEVVNFEVSGGDVKQPVKTARLALEFTPDRITLAPANIVSGSTRVQAYGVVSRYRETPMLEATLIAPNAQVSELAAIARAYGAGQGIEASGRADLQVRAHGPLNANTPLQFAGKGTLSGVTLKTPALTQPLEVRRAAIQFHGNGADVTQLDASLGGTAATGEIGIQNFARPRISFHARMDKIDVDEARGWLAEAPQGAASKGGALVADGSIAIGSLKLAGLTLTQVSADVRLRGAEAVLDPLNASLYGGRHSGTLHIDLRPAKPVYKLRSRLEHIESGQLLAAATAVNGIVSGPLSANLDLSFTPAEPVQLARSLNGGLSLKLDQGRIAGLNLTREIGLIAKFLGMNSGGENFTTILGLTGDLEIANGQATTQNLKLDLANLQASLNGSMNLADQTLNLKLLSVLDRKFSEQVGGNRVGGFMTAVFANPQGNLLIPASITGTFAKPIIAPDPAAAARLKMQSLDPRNPKQMMDGLDSVIGIFRKKKQ